MTDLAERISRAVQNTASAEAEVVAGRLHLAAHIAAAASDAGLPNAAAVTMAAGIAGETEQQVRQALGSDASPRLVAEALTKSASLVARQVGERITAARQAVGR